MAQERPVLRCQHRVRSGASGVTSGVPSVCRTEPARTNPDVQYNSQYAEERVNRSHNPTHLERRVRNVRRATMTKRNYRETAPPPTSYDRWCGEGPKRRPTKRTRSQTIIRTRDALTGVKVRRASDVAETIDIADPVPDVRLLVRLCDIRQPTERGRRARTQAAWSFVSRVSRRVRARAGVADERGVFAISHRNGQFFDCEIVSNCETRHLTPTV